MSQLQYYFDVGSLRPTSAGFNSLIFACLSLEKFSGQSIHGIPNGLRNKIAAHQVLGKLGDLRPWKPGRHPAASYLPNVQTYEILIVGSIKSKYYYIANRWMMNLEEEVEQLKEENKRLGRFHHDDSYKIGLHRPNRIDFKEEAATPIFSRDTIFGVSIFLPIINGAFVSTSTKNTVSIGIARHLFEKLLQNYVLMLDVEVLPPASSDSCGSVLF
ncbi:hypothetical protein HHK36_006694 [Tetracentron sinense]|uniref:Uncharacterized protein n=1 Tax=Tetracentron sinense TaxID=13715 RepID=A0A834ZLE1_TETSI|nr:hypothetical protein HHK36_006694 [Tetracentron sinense]